MAGLGGAFQAGKDNSWYALPSSYEPYAQDIMQAYGGSNYTPFTQAYEGAPMQGPAGAFSIGDPGSYKIGEFDLGGGPSMAAAFNKQYGTGWYNPETQQRYQGNVGGQYGTGPTTADEAGQKSAMLSQAAGNAIGSPLNPELSGMLGQQQSDLAKKRAFDIEQSKFSFKNDILPALKVLSVPALAAVGGAAFGLGGLSDVGAMGAGLGASEGITGGALGAGAGGSALGTGASSALGTGAIPWQQAYAGGLESGSLVPTSAEAAGGAAGAALPGGADATGGAAWLNAVEPGGTLGVEAGSIPEGLGAPVGAGGAAGAGAGAGGGVGAGAGGGAGGAAGAGAGAAGGGITGNATVDGILAGLQKNILGLGLQGVSLYAASKKKNEMPEAMKTLNAQGQQTSAQGQGLINSAVGGQLTAPQQANIDMYTQQAKNQLHQYFSSIGQFDSTARIQAEQLVNQQAEAMKLQMVNQTFQQGATLLGGISQGPLQAAAQYQMGQDKALIDALGNFARGVGGMFGQEAGKGTTTTA